MSIQQIFHFHCLDFWAHYTIGIALRVAEASFILGRSMLPPSVDIQPVLNNAVKIIIKNILLKFIVLSPLYL
jgi:hypothetical protein